jgi:hypothetical protein
MLAVRMDANVGPVADCEPDQHRKFTNGKHLPIEVSPRGYWGSCAAIA